MTNRNATLATRRPRTAVRRQSIWQGSSVGGALLANNAVLSQVLVDVPLQTIYSDGTVVRIRGVVGVAPDGTLNPARSEAMGIIVVTDQAFAAGAVAMPDPRVDTAADWLWHSWTTLQGDTGAVTQLDELRQVTVDNKAMRRLPGGNKLLVFIITNQTGVGLNISTGFRTLVKLH